MGHIREKVEDLEFVQNRPSEGESTVSVFRIPHGPGHLSWHLCLRIIVKDGRSISPFFPDTFVWVPWFLRPFSWMRSEPSTSPVLCKDLFYGLRTFDSSLIIGLSPPLKDSCLYLSFYDGRLPGGKTFDPLSRATFHPDSLSDIRGVIISVKRDILLFTTKMKSFKKRKTNVKKSNTSLVGN